MLTPDSAATDPTEISTPPVIKTSVMPIEVMPTMAIVLGYPGPWHADPTIAYLVRSNSLMEQKLVMAHVMGHADFFKHNVWFAPTERHMVDRMVTHAERVRSWLLPVSSIRPSESVKRRRTPVLVPR